LLMTTTSTVRAPLALRTVPAGILWPRVGPAYRKCAGPGFQLGEFAASNQSACQTAAVLAGHTFYDWLPAMHLCRTSATCDRPSVGLVHRWTIHQEPSQPAVDQHWPTEVVLSREVGVVPWLVQALGTPGVVATSSWHIAAPKPLARYTAAGPFTERMDGPGVTASPSHHTPQLAKHRAVSRASAARGVQGILLFCLLLCSTMLAGVASGRLWTALWSVQLARTRLEAAAVEMSFAEHQSLVRTELVWVYPPLCERADVRGLAAMHEARAVRE